jgi:HAD superfamily hydrolase (TIGR01509 family)
MMAAVLFDMDGTLIDSEPYWMAAEHELVARFGGTWTDEQAYGLVGNGLWKSAEILQKAGVDLPSDDIVQKLSSRVLEQVEEAIPWRPGVKELLWNISEQGISCALVTMSLRTNAESLARAVAGEVGKDVFSVIVAGDDVTEPKPHPEPYLTAARLLGVDIDDCVAVEDSEAGATSAFTAGAITIGIPLHVDVPGHLVHLLWDSLQGKTVEDLATAWNAHRIQVAS